MQIRALMLDYLRENPTGQYDGAANGVAGLAIEHGLLKRAKEPLGDEFSYALSNADSAALREAVRQEMWLLLGQGLLVFGMNENNPNWPWYRLTQRGIEAIRSQGPQPYDPDGFLREFSSRNPSADPVIIAYLVEAIRAFNHGCPIAASVILGGASEKALLLLIETFESAIQDPAKKASFSKAYRWTIHSKYQALKDALDQMISAGTLPSPLREYATTEVSGTFELIRRHRNSTGHPELYTGINPDTVFLNLRVFTEYVQRVYDLIEFLRANGANW
jgi:hypothetical protein